MNWTQLLATVFQLFMVAGLMISFSDASNFNCTAFRGCCVGEIFTCECVTDGPGVTVWNGSVFESADECKKIIINQDFVPGECGGIRAQGIRKNNITFASQLNMTIDLRYNGKTVRCTLDNGPNSLTLIGNITVNFPSG